LLVAGAIVFFGFGFGILAFAGDTPFRKRWIAVCFMLAIVATALSLRTLASAVGDAWTWSAFTLFAVGTPLMLLAMVGYATFTHLPLGTPARTEGLDEFERSFVRWIEALTSVYMVLAFTAIALVGWGALRTGLLPPWAGWFSLLFGGFLALSFPLKYALGFWIADLPLWVHVWALVVAVPLLRA
jgi:hypothetical protein